MKEIIFDLRDISKDDLKDDLCILMDRGYTPQLEAALAKFAGRVVKVIFQEKKVKSGGQ
jgi:hypothetical protein